MSNLLKAEEYSSPEKLSITNAAIDKMRQEYSSLKAFDKESYKLVKAATIDVSKTITKIEQRRKEVKAPLLEAGKLLDAEAQRIKLELSEILKPIKKERETFEAEEQRKKEEAARIEKERVEKIQRKINAIKNFCNEALTKKSSLEIKDCQELFLETCINGDSFNYQEFLEDAIEAKKQTKDKFEIAVKEAISREEKEAEFERMQKELAELKAKQEVPVEAQVASKKEAVDTSVALKNAINQTKAADNTKPSFSSFCWDNEEKPKKVEPVIFAQNASAETLIDNIIEATPFIKALRGIIGYANEAELKIIKENFNI